MGMSQFVHKRYEIPPARLLVHVQVVDTDLAEQPEAISSRVKVPITRGPKRIYHERRNANIKP
jgi:hypothetical protein